MNRLKSAWNLRTKSLAVIGLILVAMIAVLYFATDRILFSSFAKVEVTVAERNVSRVVDAIDAEQRQQESHGQAWSVWNDTFQFIDRAIGKNKQQNDNDPFIISNFDDNTFIVEDTSMWLFFDPKDNMVWGDAYDVTTKQHIPIPKEFVEHLKTSRFKKEGGADTVNGFQLFGDRLILISYQPIVTTDGESDPNGTLITGRFFNERIPDLAGRTHLNFSAYRLDDPAIPEETKADMPKLQAGQITQHPINDKLLAGYKIAKDTEGKDLLLLRVEIPREVHQQGLAARNYLVLSLLVIGVIFLIMALILLTRLYRRDQEVQELKDRFIAIASHELRTPLTSIRGGADLLGLQKLPAASQSSIKLIQEGIARLSQLTDELINVVTLEKGQFKADLQQIDATDLITKACDSIKGIAANKGLELNCQIAPDLPPVLADARLLRSAVLNLLDNALKFTDKGSVSLKADIQNGCLVIEITDTGPGIKDPQSHMLFQKFAKVASVSDSFKEGHGLGLYLTKLAVEAHKGQITVKTSPQGSTFTITLPLSKSSTSKPA